MYRCFFILITLLYKYNFFPMISLSLSFSVFSSSLSFCKPKEHSLWSCKILGGKQGAVSSLCKWMVNESARAQSLPNPTYNR